MNLTEYIKSRWNDCVRINTKDEGTLIGLPAPYIVPSPREHLNEMYYWDTFFTCKGLYLSEMEELAKNCTDNLLFLAEKYGFVPNGNRTYYLSQSQPPFLSMMVMDVYRRTHDKEYLKRAYNVLKKEYDFWMTKRLTPTGLNRFGANEDNLGDTNKHYESICRRIDYLVPVDDKRDFAVNFLADCESGWDFSPRCEFNQSKTVYVDLNCNLYAYEKNFEFMAAETENGERDFWAKKAEKRKHLMNEYLYNEGAFRDYNFEKKKTVGVFSAASFYALWAKVADKAQAEETRKLLYKLEREYGAAATEEYSLPGKYQWAYPNGWAPLQYIVIKGLDNYGYKADARRIAQKYMHAAEKMYEQTGTVWEKYNVLTGGNDTVGDYKSREMLGWSAGVYLFAKDYCEKTKE